MIITHVFREAALHGGAAHAMAALRTRSREKPATTTWCCVHLARAGCVSRLCVVSPLLALSVYRLHCSDNSFYYAETMGEEWVPHQTQLDSLSDSNEPAVSNLDENGERWFIPGTPEEERRKRRDYACVTAARRLLPSLTAAQKKSRPPVPSSRSRSSSSGVQGPSSHTGSAAYDNTGGWVNFFPGI